MLKKETTAPMKNRATDMMKMLTDTRKQVETLEKGFLADAPAVWGEIDSRLSVLERGLAVLQGNQSALMKQYLDQQKRLEKVEESVDAFERMTREIVEGDADWGVRMEEAEDSIHALQLAISSQRIEVR